MGTDSRLLAMLIGGSGGFRWIVLVVVAGGVGVLSCLLLIVWLWFWLLVSCRYVLSAIFNVGTCRA